MIDKDTLFQIGEINKTHGVGGELSFTYKIDFDELMELDHLIIERDGIFVPFFIDSLRPKSGTTALIKFEDVNDDMEARTFIGTQIFVDQSVVIDSNDDEFSLDMFIGFTITDQEAEFVGTIIDVDISTENALFVVESNNDEVLIPASESYMTNIDMENRTIDCVFPEGLIGL